ncbi:hypothetical protein BG454_17095 [Roseinatronobacter bogoriensis subsp. barguzinensis]|uniref:Uncharacterized protein n=1 Tax=Roseinatronobacter bogoriensis subsp. barguzinensis TaxID=441209 RepID=A0A2K8KD10_9RHOB|nr:hypothetical protein BG454_17095 [Rhodobaca barguzinensis]
MEPAPLHRTIFTPDGPDRSETAALRGTEPQAAAIMRISFCRYMQKYFAYISRTNLYMTLHLLGDASGAVQ